MIDKIQIISYNIKAKNYGQVRCAGCGALLAKIIKNGTAEIEVKCGKCNQINVIKLNTQNDS